MDVGALEVGRHRVVRGRLRQGRARLLTWPWLPAAPIALGLGTVAVPSLMVGSVPLTRWAVWVASWVAAACACELRASAAAARRGQLAAVAGVALVMVAIAARWAAPQVLVGATVGMLAIAGPLSVARRTERGPACTPGELAAAALVGLALGMVDVRWVLATSVLLVGAILLARGQARFHRTPRVWWWLLWLPWLADLANLIWFSHSWWHQVGRPALG